MAKKSRISKDAFDWIADTSSGAEESAAEKAVPAPKKTPATKSATKRKPAAKPANAKKPAAKKAPAKKAPAKKEAPAKQVSATSTSGRELCIKHSKDGTIMGMMESTGLDHKMLQDSMAGMADGEKITFLSWPDSLAGHTLMEIHKSHKIGGTARSPKLVKK